MRDVGIERVAMKDVKANQQKLTWRALTVTFQPRNPRDDPTGLAKPRQPSMTPYPTATELPLHLPSTPILGRTRGVPCT